ncbi:4041_t:CDS:1, partial [Racocetra persica]
MPFHIPFEITNYQEILNNVINNIDQQTLEKIKQTVVLHVPLHQLIVPSKNRRTQQIPKPQNSFVLYRRNLSTAINNATSTLLCASDNNASNVSFISKEASENWSKESNEVKQVYEVLANYAKK